MWRKGIKEFKNNNKNPDKDRWNKSGSQRLELEKQLEILTAGIPSYSLDFSVSYPKI